jgi:hypothetical protein
MEIDIIRKPSVIPKGLPRFLGNRNFGDIRVYVIENITLI